MDAILHADSQENHSRNLLAGCAPRDERGGEFHTVVEPANALRTAPSEFVRVGKTTS